MEQINVGDIFLGNIGGIQGSKKADGGGYRPVKVIDKQKYYLVCETVPMTNLYGFNTSPYRICYLPIDLNRRFTSAADLNKWIKENTMSKIFYGDDDFGICSESD